MYFDCVVGTRHCNSSKLKLLGRVCEENVLVVFLLRKLHVMDRTHAAMLICGVPWLWKVYTPRQNSKSLSHNFLGPLGYLQTITRKKINLFISKSPSQISRTNSQMQFLSNTVIIIVSQVTKVAQDYRVSKEQRPSVSDLFGSSLVTFLLGMGQSVF